MKNIFIMLLAMFSCVASAYAQSFTVDGLSYNVTKAPDEESTGEVEVTGGEIKEVIEFPETVTYEEVTYTVTSIGSNAFSGRTNSSNYTRKYIIPGTVRSIKESAFYDNYHLEEVEFNEGLQTIGKAAFGFNFVLKEIRIPSTVTTIGETAFITNRQNLATISCLAATPPALLGTETFKGRTDATLHVVTSDVEAYQEAEYWKDFSEIAGDISYRERCYSPVITCDDDLLTMSCKTEGATIYYTSDGSVPDENDIRYTSPISYTTNQIIRAIAISEGCENSAVRDFYDREAVGQLTDEQGVSYTLKQDEDGDFYYSVTGHTDELASDIVIADLGGCPVRSIEKDAFRNCTSLTAITISNSVTSIGEAAFADCANLSSIKIPSSVATFGNAVFLNCSSLNDVKIIVMDYSEFCNNQVAIQFITPPLQLIDKDGNEIKEYIIPNGVTTIGAATFSNCSGLTSIIIPNSVKVIEDAGIKRDYINTGSARLSSCGVFEGCTSLTSVKMGNNISSIGSRSFNGCSNLSSITIPSSVTSIGENAFSGCSGLKMVTSGIITPFAVTVFNGFRDATLVVPQGSRADYMSVDGWNDFAFIYEEGETMYDWEQADEQGVKYTLRQDEDGSIYYSVTGYTDELSAEVEIPADLGGCPVRNIGESAFRSCASLESIILPDGLNSISAKAFEGCSNMYTVLLGSQLMTIGESAFRSCASLESIILPDGLNSISANAFYGCTSLESIILPRSVTSIDNYAFYGCGELATIKLGSQLVAIGNSAFAGCGSLSSITIPNSVINIGNEAFRRCGNLSSITLPNKVTAVSNGTFEDCNALASVKMGENVTSIGDNAFNGCSSLTSIALPAILKSIGYDAFARSALVSIDVPNSVESIGSSAFASSKLETAILGEGITEIAGAMFSDCRNLSSVTIPDGVTNIGERAFWNCSALISIDLPETLTSMGGYVFTNSALKSIELPNSFTVITEGLFQSNNFSYIKLGNNVRSIGKNAFGSRDLVLEIGTSTPPTISSSAFPNIEYLPDITVIVPDAKAVTAYEKKAVWTEMTYSHQDNMSEVTVDTPGDMSFELITECGMQPAKVVSLKVNGTINADDFMQILTNMKSLLRLDLSDCDITEIPDNALSGKTQLQELTLPSKLQTIGKNAFKDCPYLKGALELPSTLTSIGDYAFAGTYYTSVNMPYTLKTIGDYAFYKLPIEQQLVLPSRGANVGAHAFEGTKITKLSILGGVSSIGERAFAGTGITELSIQGDVTSIGDGAFADAPVQGHVTIPDGITYLGREAFKNTQISTVFLPNSVTTLSQGLFQGCKNLNLVYVPDNFTGMGNYAFDGCEALTTVRLSANTTTMGEYSMQGTPMEYVKVPSKVEVLSRGALKNCQKLVSLALPASLKTVEAEALIGCTALRNLSVEAIEPPAIKDRSAIRGISTDKCIISIPTQSYRAYVLAEYWGQFVQMRNDIAVETAGNGEITFESVEEEEEEEEEEVVYAKRRGVAQAKKRAPSYATPEDALTYANNGSSIFVPKNGKVLLRITPNAGEELVSATLDGKDITPDIKDNVYIATADKANAKLVVKFSGAKTQQGDVNGDGEVNVTDIQSIANHILGKATGTFDVTVADMNGDGEVNVTDIQSVANLILGINPASSKARMPFELDPQ